MLQQRLLLNSKESCEILSIKPKTLYSLVKRGLIKRHPSVRKLLIPLGELQRFASIK